MFLLLLLICQGSSSFWRGDPCQLSTVDLAGNIVLFQSGWMEHWGKLWFSPSEFDCKSHPKKECQWGLSERCCQTPLDIFALCWRLLCFAQQGINVSFPIQPTRSQKLLLGILLTYFLSLVDDIISKLPWAIPWFLLEKTTWPRQFAKEPRAVFGEESAVCPDKLLHLPVFLFQEKKMLYAISFSVLSPRKALPGTQGGDVFSSGAQAGLRPLHSWGIVSFFQKEAEKLWTSILRMAGEKLGRNLAAHLYPYITCL